MSKATETAAQLRIIADSFDRLGDVEVGKMYLLIKGYTKDQFSSLVSILSTPFEAETDYAGKAYQALYLTHRGEALQFCVSAESRVVGELVEPARPAIYAYPGIGVVAPTGQIISEVA